MKAILVATDGSNHAREAIALACDLAVRHEARLLLLHVLLRDKEPETLVRLAEAEHLSDGLRTELLALEQSLPPEPVVPEVYMREPGHVSRPVPDSLLTRVGEEILDAACRQADTDGIAVERLGLEDGKAAERIIACAAREGADTIVLGSRGLGEIDAMTFGSVSHQVCLGSPCTCISVRQSVEQAG